jgi:hypothetical protein
MTLKQLCTRYGYNTVQDAAEAIGRTDRTLRAWHKDDEQREKTLIPLLETLSPLKDK